MAYEDHNECAGCGIGVPEVKEGADVDKKLYDVHLYASVRVKVKDVQADSQLDAVEKACDKVELARLFRDVNMRDLCGADDVEDACEINEAFVDEVGDDDYGLSRFHNLRAAQYSGEIADWHSRFDAIEIHKCAEIFNIDRAEYHVTQVDDEPLEPDVDEIVTKEFYGIYGHLPAGGVESLCDCANEADANAVAAALKSFQ